MTRQEANLEICEHLTNYFAKKENKDSRFWQGLFNLGIIDSKLHENDTVRIKDDHNLESIKSLHKLRIV